ncbi:MAG: tautomerase family protein, partial [Pseudomonadota bacterium]|nr:tautomerase family protein [Pseudomonadota bacterium]
VADVTQSLVERLGKPAAAGQIVISEFSSENYAAGGQLLADRTPTLSREDAHVADTPR